MRRHEQIVKRLRPRQQPTIATKPFFVCISRRNESLGTILVDLERLLLLYKRTNRVTFS